MTTCQRRTWSSSPTPRLHGDDSDNEDLGDGGGRGKRTTLPPFIDFHNGVNSYDAVAGGDVKRVEDMVRAAGIDVALRLVLR